MTVLGLAASRWLRLAASPTFMLMAFATAIGGDFHAPELCSQEEHPQLLQGMIPMYLLMALFHLDPWFSRQQAGG